MPYRLELLFITWLTCFSISPDAIAVAATTAQSAEDPSIRLELSVAENSVSEAVNEVVNEAVNDTVNSLSPEPAAELPASQPFAWMEWAWWGAIALIPIGVMASIFYSLHPRQQGRQHEHSPDPDPQPGTPETPLQLPLPDRSVSTAAANSHFADQADPSHPHPDRQPDSIVLSATTRLSKVDIVEALIQDLHSADPHKRRSAIWELGQRGDSRAIQPLADLLIDADSKQRGLILAAISEIGTRTLKPMNRALMISLQDDSSEVRKNAIRDVSRVFEWMTQVSQVLQYATSDPDAEVRETAEWALGQLNRSRLPSLEENQTKN